MPIGRHDYPPGFNPSSTPSILDRVILGFGIMVGVITQGFGAIASALLSILRQDSQHATPIEPLSPEAAATAVVKGAAQYADCQDEAQLSGVDKARFDVLVELTGNPPGPETLIDLLNRGVLHENQVERGMRQGYIKDEWIPYLIDAQHRLLTAIEYVEAAVQNHLSYDDAKAKATQAGLAPEEFDTAYQTAGNPPGVVEMLHLMLRGHLSAAQVEQGIRESRYKDKYIPALMALAEYLPPPRTVTTLLSHGAIDTQTAHELFVKNGLTQQLADAYVASALHTKTASHKELSVTTIRSLYADGLISRADAVSDMARVGYTPTDANLVLDLAAATARQKIRNQAINRVRTLFVSRKLDKAQASADLAKLGVDAEQTGFLMDAWAVELTVPTRTLTVGQLNTAYKLKLITETEFIARVEGLGYDTADATILAHIDVPPTAP